jgi:HEAT repeat protein
VIPFLINKLDYFCYHCPPSVYPQSKYAAATLSNLGSVAIPALIQVVKNCHKNRHMCIGATEALGNMGAINKAPIPNLIQMLKDKNEGVRRNSAKTLGKRGATAKAAIPALIETLKDKDARVRRNAIKTLGKMGAESKEAVVTTLMQALSAPDIEIWSFAALSLSEMGIIDNLSIPALIQALQKNEKGVYIITMWLLGELKIKDRIPILIRILKDPRDYIRLRAISMLSEMKTEAKSVIPHLNQVIEEDEESIVRERAIQALKIISPADL